MALTGRLLDGIGGTVFAAGDNAYMSGTAQQYRDCYEPGWGRHKGRTRPAPGNHEYETPGAAPYFDYFGANAGPPGLGYYSFQLGTWHAISLNSNIDVGEGSPQGRWLRLRPGRRTRRSAPSRIGTIRCSARGRTATTRRCARSGACCTPPASTSSWSGTITCTSGSRPQDPDGRFDPVRGIRQFIAGTGGANLYNFVTVRANSEKRISAFGVLKLTLEADRYDWEFIPVSGEGDRGSDVVSLVSVLVLARAL